MNSEEAVMCLGPAKEARGRNSIAGGELKGGRGYGREEVWEVCGGTVWSLGGMNFPVQQINKERVSLFHHSSDIHFPCHPMVIIKKRTS